jgi:hypothetical protein
VNELPTPGAIASMPVELTMAADSDRKHHSTPSQNTKRYNALRDKCRASSSTVIARGPGFVVWLSGSNGKTRGFITWTETAVAELSPGIQDAWRFPSVKAANDSVARALGPAVENYAVAIFPDCT